MLKHPRNSWVATIDGRWYYRFSIFGVSSLTWGRTYLGVSHFNLIRRGLLTQGNWKYDS